MAKPWSEVSSSDAYLALPREERVAARKQYFDSVVAPQVDPAEQVDVWRQFDSETAGSLDVRKPGMIERAVSSVKSTASGMLNEARKEYEKGGLSEVLLGPLDPFGYKTDSVMGGGQVNDTPQKKAAAVTRIAARPDPLSPEDAEVARAAGPVRKEFIDRARSFAFENPDAKANQDAVAGRAVSAAQEQQRAAREALATKGALPAEPGAQRAGRIRLPTVVTSPRTRAQKIDSLRAMEERGEPGAKALRVELMGMPDNPAAQEEFERSLRDPSLAQVVSRATSTIPPMWQNTVGGAAQYLGAMFDKPDMIAGGRAISRKAADELRAISKSSGNSMGQQVANSVAQTLGLMVPVIAGSAVLGGGLTSVLTGMSTAAGAQAYAEGIEEGLSPEQAATYAFLKGGIEYWTEKLPTAELLKKHKSFTDKAVMTLSKELPSEMAATTLESAIDKLSTQPDMTLREFSNAMMVTIAATPISTAALAGGMSLAQRTLGGPVYEPPPPPPPGAAPPLSAADILGQPEQPTAAPPPPPGRTPETVTGVESMLADPRALWAEATRRPAILNTLEQVITENPAFTEQQKADATAALRDMQADPRAIFGVATARPDVYDTISKAAAETARLERAGARPSLPTAAAPGAQPAPPTQAVEAISPKDSVAAAFAAAEARAAVQRDHDLARLQSEARRERMEAAFELELARAEAAGSGLRPESEVPPTAMEVALGKAGVKRPDDGGTGPRYSREEAFERLVMDSPIPVEAVPEERVPRALQRATSFVENSMGKQVVFFSMDMKQDGAFEGGVMPDDPGTYYVNVKAERAWKALVGHELLHTLKRTNPAVYRNLLNRVASALDKKAAAKKYVRRYGDMPGDVQIEEMVADLFGDRMSESAFWMEVFRKSDRGRVRALVNSILAALDALRIKMRIGERRTGYKTEEIIKDVEAVRKAVAEAFDAWQKMPVSEAAAPAESGTTLQSRPDRKPDFGKLIERLPKTKSGDLKGAGGMEPRSVWNLVQRMERMARAGEQHKGWYEESAKEILGAFNGNKAAARIFSQMIAITSANTEVKANFTQADKALFQYAQGKAISVGTQAVDDKLNDLLYFGIPWEGRKTNAFYTNLIEAIDGKKPSVTTQDMHMGMIAFGKKQITDDEYTFLDMVTKHVASRVGMTPQQTQASVWVMQKARSLIERYEEKGYHLGKSPQAKRRMAITDAGINYGDLIRGRGWFWPDSKTEFPSAREVRTRGQQLTAEVKPSTKLPIGQAVANLSMAKLQAYQQDAFARVFGKRGVGALLEEMGLDRSQYRVVQGAGGYDAMMAPNEIVTLNTDAKTAERVAKAWMYIFKQDAVPFFRTDDKLRADPNAAQAVKIRFAETLSNPLLRKVYDSLREQVHPGVGLTKLDYNVIAIVNFRAEDTGEPFLMPDPTFIEKIAEVVQRNSIGAKINGYGRFGAETSYPYHDWEADGQGAGLLAAAAGGRPDLQERVHRWAELFQRFAESRGARERRLESRPDRGAGDQATGKSSENPVATARAAVKLDRAKPPAKSRLGKCHPLTWRKVVEERDLHHIISVVNGWPSAPQPRAPVMIWHSLAFDPKTGSIWEPTTNRWYSLDAMKSFGFEPVASLTAKETTRLAMKAGFYTDQQVYSENVKPLRGAEREWLLPGQYDADWSVVGRGKSKRLESRPESLDERAHEAATSEKNAKPEPTEAQQRAGNYAKGHVRVSGLPVTIESPEGSTRAWKRADGATGESVMKAHYGYIRGTEGKDGDQLDIFIKPGTPTDYNGPVFVLDQTQKGTNRFDEHKVMLGWKSVTEAAEAYKANYQRGWDGMEGITSFKNPSEFKAWLAQANLDGRAAVQMLFSRAPQTEGFKEFFAGSKVVDAAGNPQVVYHGTSKDVDFNAFRVGQRGAWFTEDPEAASSYAVENDAMNTMTAIIEKKHRSPRVIPVYLSIKNPYIPSEKDNARMRFASSYIAEQRMLVMKAKLAGHDGMRLENQNTWVVFKPTQIKSAVGNRGTFDASRANMLYSRPNVVEPGDIAGAWRELAKAEDVFQRQRSDAKGMKQIVKELAPKIEVLRGVPINGDITGSWQFLMEDGAQAFVTQYRAGGFRYDRGFREGMVEPRRTVQVDLSALNTKSSRGSAVYDIVATYAHNNGMVFIGDLTGITTRGAIRRVENLLSSALKFGTTRHIEPHFSQMEKGFLNRTINMKVINWKPTDDDHNIRELLEASFHNTKMFAPQIESVIYDFNENKFKYVGEGDLLSGIDKGDISNEGFARLAARANTRFWQEHAQQEAPQENLIFGPNTMKRAALTNTLMKAQNEGWWNTAVSELRRMGETGDVGSLRGMLYSKPGAREDRSQPRSDERPGERYAVKLEWASTPQDGDWISLTGDGRYEIERTPDGYLALAGGDEIGWHRNRGMAMAMLRDQLQEDVRTGAVKNPAVARSVLNQHTEEQVARVVSGWKKLAESPTIFRYKKTDEKNLTRVFADMGLAQYVAEMHEIDRIGMRTINIIFFDDTVGELNFDDATQKAYVNVSSFVRDSQMGSVMYQAVLAWAHNNGYKLIPDPAGLTYVNSFRRTEQMLSSALRYGNTKHMAPHPDQGVYGWNDSPKSDEKNDENIALLALTSMRNVFEHVPRAAEYRYDFEKKGIVDAKGKPITKENLDEMVKEKGARNIGTGRTTLTRAIFTHSLIQDAAGAQKVISGELTPGTILSGGVEQSLQLYSRPDADRFAPKKPGVVKRLTLASIKAATQVARPAGAVLDVANKVADVAAMLPGKPLAVVSSRIYDRLMQAGERFFKAGEVRQQIVHGIVADYGLPEPYLDRRDARDIDIQKHLRKSKQVIDRIAALDDAESMVAYQWMQEKPNLSEEQRLLALLPEGSRQALVEMKATLSSLGREAVDLGLLSQETFERNDMAYLHRSYKKYEVENPQAVASSSRAKALRADSFRGRGLRDDVALSRLPGVQKGDHYVRLEQREPRADGGLGKLRRVMYVKAGQPISSAYSAWRNDGVWEVRYIDKQGEVGMWRDLTTQERERLGEIREVRYAFARTMIGLVHDIETAKFLKWVGEEYSVADEAAVAERGGRVADAVDKAFTVKTYADDEWVQVPGTVAQGTRLFKYGLIQSRYIPGHIWNDIRATVNVRDASSIRRLYDDLLRAWKISKTALSPAVHTNNVMANFVLSDIAEVKSKHIIRSLQIIIDAERGIDQQRAMLERYLDSGAELGTPALHELRREVIEPLLTRLQGEENEVLAQASLVQAISLAAHGNVRQAWAALSSKSLSRMAQKPFEAMLSAYQLEDSVFRLAKWLKEVDAGKDDRAAGTEARKAFLDYRINAPWIQALRRGPFPFFAFTYRVVPILAETLAKKPWKMMKYAAAGYAVNALAYAILGGLDDREKRERAMLPDEKIGHTILGVPRLLRLPWNDDNDSPVFLDIRRWVPGGDIFDVAGSHSAVPMPQWLTFGGYWGLAIEMASNKNQFTGKEIWKESDTKGEAAVKVVDHLFRFLSPNLPIPNPLGYAADAAMVERGLLQTYAWKSIEAAGTGATDDFGRERSVPQSILSALGVKVATYPEDQLRRNLNMKRDMELRDLSETTARYRREFRRSKQTDEDRKLFEQRMQKQGTKKQEISRRYGERTMGLEPVNR